MIQIPGVQLSTGREPRAEHGQRITSVCRSGQNRWKWDGSSIA